MSKKKDEWGTIVDWVVHSPAQDLERFQQGGLVHLSHWGVIEIKGPDGAGFLQRLSSQSVKEMQRGETLATCFLHGNSKIIAVGFVHRMEHSFLIVHSPQTTSALLTHLTMMHFSEDLQIQETSKDYAFFWMSAPSASKLGALGIKLWSSDLMSQTFWGLLPMASAPVDEILKLEKIEQVGHSTFHAMRMQSLFFLPYYEIDGDRLLLEAQWLRGVSRTKGCYPGQEAVERILTYGGVNQKLIGVKIKSSKRELTSPIPLYFEDQLAGQLLSFYPHPSDENGSVGCALVKKKYWQQIDALRSAQEWGIQIKSI